MDDVFRWILDGAALALVSSHLWLALVNEQRARRAGPRSLKVRGRPGLFRHRWFRWVFLVVTGVLGLVWLAALFRLVPYDVMVAVSFTSLVTAGSDSWATTVLTFDDVWVSVGAARYRKDAVSLVPRGDTLVLQTKLLPTRLALLPAEFLTPPVLELLASEGLRSGSEGRPSQFPPPVPISTGSGS